jgi:hypothetical protein
MEGVVDRLASATNMPPLLAWVWGSAGVYVLATQALWLAKSSWRSPHRRWLVQVGRLLFYLAIPYLALGGWPRQPYRGLLSLEELGIVGLGAAWPVTRWLEAVGLGLAWGSVALLFLLLAWRTANRGAGGVWLGFSRRPWWALVVDVLYLEVHWAFYRSGMAVALGHGDSNLYAGVFLGLGLVYLEWSLNPYWRQGWRRESQAAVRWLRAALALIIAVLFLISRNLWVCLGVHLLLELSVWQLGRARTRLSFPQTTEGA